MAEDRAGRGDPAMTSEGKVESSTHAMAFDGGDYGSGIAGDCVHKFLSQSGKFVRFRAGERVDFVEVGSGGKVAITGDY